MWRRVNIQLSHLHSININFQNRYGIANVHLMHAVQYSLTSIQLNITADKPVLSMTTRMGNTLSLYNYTGLLTSENVAKSELYCFCLIDCFCFIQERYFKRKLISNVQMKVICSLLPTIPMKIHSSVEQVACYLFF